MRVPLSWLREYVELGDASVEAIDAALVRVGLEVEAVHRLGADVAGPIVVGEVLAITELAEFKKPIRYCQVDVGDAEPANIVCGATNFAVGDWVVVVLPGATLPGGFVIGARKTYGHVSEGMICSLRELGLGEDHDGILVLPRGGLPEGTRPGTDAIALLELVDTVFELAITPDRGYCFSVRGIARELAHGLGATFRDPGAVTTPAVTAEPPYPIRVADPQGCDRFVARAVTGVDPAAPTPLWMRRRLLLAGVRSISLAVDVTNYLMLELGQPMHAFDRGSLTGPIVVRRAEPGERVRTLDGANRAVDPEDLLITDDTGPIGLAAVMGGATTEVAAAHHGRADRVPRTGIPVVGGPHRAPAQAAQRGVQALRARRGPARWRRSRRSGPSSCSPSSAAARPTRASWTWTSARPIAPIQLDAGLPSRVIGVDVRPGHRRGTAARHRSRGRRRRRADRHPAELAPRPHRPVRPGRGGGADLRVRPGAVRASAGAGQPRSDRGPASPAERRPHPRRGGVRGGAQLPVRLAHRCTTRSAWNGTIRAASPAGSPTRSRTRSRSCAPRCSPACSRR